MIRKLPIGAETDQFVIIPGGRITDVARAYAAGDEVRTVIAGYHWFMDWGRDTMISLEGLLGETGIGSISEVFDAEPPFTPHGCIAQAWSVAEVLRTWAKTAG
jgi:glycogen debranching enzyme